MLLASIDTRSEDELLWLLRYKTRRRIILAIGDAGKISATALRDSLKISTGSLYYNLRQLKRFVTQDNDRNYVLTEEGLKVYRVLKEKGTISSSDLISERPQGRFMKILQGVFFPLWLYSPLYERIGVTILLPALSFILSSILLIYSRRRTLLLHFYETAPDPLRIIGSHLLNIFILYGLITLLSILLSGTLFRRSEGESLSDRVRLVALASIQDELKFMLSLFVALLPLMFYPAIISVDKLFHLSIIPPKGTPLYYQVKDALLIVAQGISLPFLTALTAYGRRLNGTMAALVILLVFFISYVFYQMLTIGAIT
ncbi:MAG TPA: ArsR family transcriptional regulator [Nitrososphaeria archaeon]|nr:MAG: hypothetical protein DRN68_09865 [Nitrososphaerota archaeon]HDJ66909.1 ArsR family transcriptional regulator [Nitrososphaeria archaeon]